MLRNLAILITTLFVASCTNLDDRHVFNYKIEGSAEFVDDMHVVMGPGLDWRAGEQIDLPVDITHEIFGQELVYKFEADHSNPNADVNLQVYIDGELIEEKSEFTSVDGTNRITISGTFIGD